MIRVALACLALLAGIGTARAGWARQTPAYGVVAHLTRPGEFEYAREEIALMRDAGIGLVRTAFDWNRVQPRAGVWSFDHLDRVVSLADSAGIDVLGVLAYRVPWAPHPADDPGPWLAFVRKVVARYHDRVRYWEVWNEPNQRRFFMAAPDARRYAGLLRQTYAAIKAVDSSLVVLNGGTARIPWPYLDSLYAAGAPFDVLSIHPYRPRTSPERGGLFEDLTRLRALMRRHGGGDSPIWMTEMGWPTHRAIREGLRRRISEEAQARYLARAFLLSFQAGVDLVCWYELVSPETRATDGRDHFGLTHRDLRPKPAYHAYRALIAARPPASVRHRGAWARGDHYTPHWQRPDGQLGWAVWTAGEEETVRVTWQGTVRAAWTVLGEPVTLPEGAHPEGAHTLTIEADSMPLYLIGPMRVTLSAR